MIIITVHVYSSRYTSYQVTERTVVSLSVTDSVRHPVGPTKVLGTRIGTVIRDVHNSLVGVKETDIFQTLIH